MLRHRRDHDHGPDDDRLAARHGDLYELDAIAAAIIGGTLLTGGRGTIIGSLLGVLVFTTITNLFILNNLSTEIQNIAKGVIIVAAVLLQQRRVTPRRSPHLARPPHLHPSCTRDPHTSPLHGTAHRKRSTDVRTSPDVALTSAAAAALRRRGALGAGALLTACTSNERRDADHAAATAAPPTGAGGNDAPGKKVTIGFSAPGRRPRLDRRHHRQRQGAGREVLRRELKAVEAQQRRHQQIARSRR